MVIEPNPHIQVSIWPSAEIVISLDLLCKLHITIRLVGDTRTYEVVRQMGVFSSLYNMPVDTYCLLDAL